MQITIEIVDVTVVNKGKYKVAEVTAKQDGKTNTKKVMSFGAQEQSFKFLSSDKVKKGDIYNVEIEKNADGYWDWVKVSFANTNTADSNTISSPGKSIPAPNRGNYETPEERAMKQIYIVRQSSIGHAIEIIGPKKTIQEYLDVATVLFNYIFAKPFKDQIADIDPDADINM